VREKSGLDKIKEGLKVLSGDSKARIERAKEKLRAEVKRIAKEARYLASPNQCLGFRVYGKEARYLASPNQCLGLRVEGLGAQQKK
jgi:hypothetical protein